MFSVVSFAHRGSEVTITHDALDLTIREPPCAGKPPGSASQTCSLLSAAVGKLAVGILLECFLVVNWIDMQIISSAN